MVIASMDKKIVWNYRSHFSKALQTKCLANENLLLLTQCQRIICQGSSSFTQNKWQLAQFAILRKSNLFIICAMVTAFVYNRYARELAPDVHKPVTLSIPRTSTNHVTLEDCWKHNFQGIAYIKGIKSVI